MEPGDDTTPTRDPSTGDWLVDSAEQFANAERSMPVVEMGGIGPKYEEALLTCWLRAWQWLEDRGFEEDDFGDDFMMDHHDDLTDVFDGVDPSGAMAHQAVSNAVHVHLHGYQDWLDEAGVDRHIQWEPHTEWPPEWEDG